MACAPSDRFVLIREFEAATDDTLFSQHTVAAIRSCSLATLERDRWKGTGIPFRKLGHHVRYSKSDIKKWLEQNYAVQSTTVADTLKNQN